MAKGKIEENNLVADDLEEDLEDLDPDAVDLDDDLDEDLDDDLEDDWDEDEDEDEDEESDDEEGDDEALDELEAEELEMLTEDELSETLVIDEAAELRAIRRAEMAMTKDPGEPKPDEFVCSSCFLVKRASQLADKRNKICRDCAA